MVLSSMWCFSMFFLSWNVFCIGGGRVVIWVTYGLRLFRFFVCVVFFVG